MPIMKDEKFLDPKAVLSRLGEEGKLREFSASNLVYVIVDGRGLDMGEPDFIFATGNEGPLSGS